MLPTTFESTSFPIVWLWQSPVTEIPETRRHELIQKSSGAWTSKDLTMYFVFHLLIRLLGFRLLAWAYYVHLLTWLLYIHLMTWVLYIQFLTWLLCIQLQNKVLFYLLVLLLKSYDIKVLKVLSDTGEFHDILHNIKRVNGTHYKAYMRK
jgi:hypothetical protein